MGSLEEVDDASKPFAAGLAAVGATTAGLLDCIAKNEAHRETCS
jgi:hypothetical protein